MQGGPGSIAQRIALEGEDDIKNALKELGDVGEKAFNQVEEAAGLSGSKLLLFSNVIAGIREHAENAHKAFEPVKEQFNEMREGAAKFGEALSNVGERILPNFREMVALGAAAGVAGLVEFIKSGAEAAKETGDLARTLGMTVTKFQELKGAAAIAGIEGEKFVSSMSRFAGNAEKAGDAQIATLADIAKSVFGDVSTLGAEVLRGSTQQAQGLAATVIRGSRDMQHGATIALTAIDDRISGSIQKNTELGKAIVEIARLVQGVGIAAGIKQFQNIKPEQLAQQMANVAAQSDQAGKNMRNLFSSMGARSLVPATTAFEALERYTKGWKEELQDSVRMIKMLPSGEVVRKTLEEAFLETADKIKDMNSDVQKLAFIRTNFGRDAARFGEMFKNGGEGIKDFMTEFSKLGIEINPEETILGSKFTIALEHFETAITNLRTAAAVGLSPALTPMIEEMTGAVGKLFPLVREWSEETAKNLAPGMHELAEYIGGATEKAEVHSQWVKTLITMYEGAAQAVKLVAGAFQFLSGVADVVASVVNAVFGTHFDGVSLIAILAIGKITGAFTLLSATVGLFLDALSLVARAFTFTITVAADLGLIRAGVVALTTVFNGFKLFLVEFFGLRSIAALFAPMLAAIGPAGWIILGLGAVAIALYAWKGSWEEVFNYLAGKWQDLKDNVSQFIDLIKLAVEALGRLLSKGADVQQQAAEQTGDLKAAGGMITGRGGIDTIPIWATAGEFMVRTAAVAKYGLGFLHAVNSMSLPRNAFAAGGPITSPAAWPRFADGGPVRPVSMDQEGFGRYFTLSIDGNSWKNLYAPEDVANSMVSYARGKQILQTGRAPEWKNK